MLPNKEWSTSPVFPALESLRIRGNPASADNFVFHLSSKDIYELGLTTRQDPRVLRIAADFFHSLRRNTLHTLSLTLSHSPIPNYLSQEVALYTLVSPLHDHLSSISTSKRHCVFHVDVCCLFEGLRLGVRFHKSRT